MTIEEFKKQEIERMLSEGKTTQEIGDSLGLTKQAICNWLNQHGYKSVTKWIKD